MNGHRLAEETTSSRSTSGLNERLATPLSEDHRQANRPATVRHSLRRFDRVATPAVVGTTFAWGTMILVRWLLGTQDMGWVPSTRVLLIAYAATLLLAVPLAHRPQRTHVIYPILATFLGFAFACVYTYGEYQSWSWELITRNPGMQEIFLRNVGAIAVGTLAMGVVWIPMVIAAFHGRKTLAERVREEKPNR